ncbi:alkaline shock response membrane anchor protein AmaP [Streptococcus sp. H31]|uniref:alkaline shock response membrane anchor protein AmaP n=1 Tax=Streptococcus huangxiaojuni TaxID=3237239 RepID=UPI0034A1D968
MNKLAKLFIILTGIILLTLLGAVAVHYVSLALLPDEFRGIVHFLRTNPFWKEALSPYLFWLALGFMALVLMIIMVVAFYPRTYTEIELEDNQSGKLKLKKSALESYVRTVVEEEGVMKAPNVSAKLYKNKFKIRVSGKVIPRINITEKVLGLKEAIRTGLDAFFGINNKVDYRIDINHIESREQTLSRRVE